MNFRYDIGVLRAIAVIAVVLFHFKAPFFQGGFVGVDIFFVISGFLMTSIILKGFQQQNFNFWAFYSKRAQRIVPALAVLLSITVLLGFLTVLPKDIDNIKSYALSSLFFVSNISYYLSSGYFENDSQSNFLLHTWSLSVEWQFYFIYPILLYPFRLYVNKNNGQAVALLSLLILVSFFGMAYYNDKDNNFAFFMFPARAWEMLAGGVVFLLQRAITPRPLTKAIVCTLSYLTLLYCIIRFDDRDITWPSYYTLIPVIATALIILFHWERKLFKTPALQFIGKISYSWYLWHWPLFVLSYYFAFVSPYKIVLLMFASLLMAALSYYLIEKNNRLASPKAVALGASLCIMLCLGIGYASSHDQESEIYYLSHYNENYRKEFLHKQFRTGTCHIDVQNTFRQFDKKGCLFLHPSKENVLLIGDSHAGALAYSFKNKLEAQDKNFLQATVSTTYPLLDTKGPKNSIKVIDYIYKDFIPKNAKKIDKVYITAHWGSGQHDYPTLKKKLQQLIAYLQKQGIAYCIIGQTPAYTMTYGDILALEKKLNTSLEHKYILKQAKDYNTALAKDFKGNDYLDLRTLQFIKYQNKQCYMYDDDHLSFFGANQLVEFVLNSK